MCERRFDADSDSVGGGVRDDCGFEGDGFGWKVFEKVKLSSEREVLSRRNAAVAMCRPVWRRTIASSIRPRWQHAWPKIKYLVGTQQKQVGKFNNGDENQNPQF